MPTPCRVISAADGLGRPAFLDHQPERVILVVDDLLVLEQFEEAIVGNVLDVAGSRRRGTRTARPIKAKAIAKRMTPRQLKFGSLLRVVVFLGITIGLGHRECCAGEREREKAIMKLWHCKEQESGLGLVDND